MLWADWLKRRSVQQFEYPCHFPRGVWLPGERDYSPRVSLNSHSSPNSCQPALHFAELKRPFVTNNYFGRRKSPVEVKSLKSLPEVCLKFLFATNASTVPMNKHNVVRYKSRKAVSIIGFYGCIPGFP